VEKRALDRFSLSQFQNQPERSSLNVVRVLELAHLFMARLIVVHIHHDGGLDFSPPSTEILNTPHKHALIILWEFRDVNK
jgi:hypothetical protein